MIIYRGDRARIRRGESKVITFVKGDSGLVTGKVVIGEHLVT